MDATSPTGAVRIGVRDVGSRVVLRYRLAPDEFGPAGESLTDVVGILETWNEGTQDPAAAGSATVLRASGERVVVPLASVVAGKVLPAAFKPRHRQPQANNPPS